MKKILDIRHFVILLLLGVIVFLKSDNKPVIQEVIKELHGEVVHDTVSVTEYIMGEDIYHDTTIYIPTLIQVDTLEILKEFYTKTIKLDTIKLNNNQGFIYLIDSISKNNIISRQWSATIKPKIVREPSPELPKVRNQVYVGFNGALSQNDWVNSLGTSVLLKTKNDKIFQLGVGVENRTVDGISGGFTPFINGGVYWKIKLKKN